MDWQLITVGGIVLAALAVTGYRLVRYFTNPLRKCDGCSSGCGGCSLEELKREIAEKKASR